MLVAVACFAGMDAVLKVLSTSYPALQVGALRGASSLPFVLASVAVTRRWRELKVVRWELHLVRGVLALVMLALAGSASAVYRDRSRAKSVESDLPAAIRAIWAGAMRRATSGSPDAPRI